VIGKLLRDRRLVPKHPRRIRVFRPDLVPDAKADASNEVDSGPARPESYLSKLLFGWIGEWVELPAVGFWHEDETDAKRN
jgi:hypothetical protein